MNETNIQQERTTSISPLRILLPVGLGTSLSLIGDTTQYTVLPTHTLEVGISIASVGLLLSANRWIRLLLNGPVGHIYDRWPRRRLFVPALFIAALSTALYALPYGFWSLLLGRLLWGVAWVGIWIGGNTIILDITTPASRGRWIGIYQIAFFLGVSSGALLGGFLTDWLGYRGAMIVAATMTLAGALLVFLFVPETRSFSPPKLSRSEPAGKNKVVGAAQDPAEEGGKSSRNVNFLPALALMGSNRLVVAGFLASTLGLYLAERLGQSVQLAGVTLGVASLTGIMLGINSLVSMAAAPLFGSLSDRAHNRWRTAAGGLLPGIAGFGLLALASPLLALFGVPLTAVSGGSNQGLSTATASDAGSPRHRSRRLGILFTTGDLTSAIGPLLAFALIPILGVRGVYLIASGLFFLMFLVALWQSNRNSSS